MWFSLKRFKTQCWQRKQQLLKSERIFEAQEQKQKGKETQSKDHLNTATHACMSGSSLLRYQFTD
jgi:hypothetical protein